MLPLLVAVALAISSSPVTAQSACGTTVPSPVGCQTSINAQGTFVNQGMVGFGVVGQPSDVDSFGDTLGGIGSAIAIQPGSFRRTGDIYTGTLIMQPDRGHNSGGAAPVDYPARQHQVTFTLNPYTGTAANGGIGSLSLAYQNTLVYVDPVTGNLPFTGQNPTAIRPATGNDPIEPVATSPKYGDAAVSVDAEGLAILSDGTFYISDEYYPAIHMFDAAGVRQATIMPPQAVIPHSSAVATDYDFDTTSGDPANGRVPNQGFEGLTVSADNTRLYALLQSATVQDGGSDGTKGVYTRLFGYDISRSRTNPTLVEEYVVQLPLIGGSTGAQSEMLYVSPGVFLVLSRDGRGNGNGNPPTPSQSSITSQGKNAGLVSVESATNIAGLFDGTGATVLLNGALNPAITPAQFQPFVEFTNNAQLAKFGLQNGQGPFPTRNAALPTDIVGKFESLALVSVLDPATPNDYFLFSAADNDFITANGRQSFDPPTYADSYATGTGQDVPNQVFVFRVTLPGAQVPNYLNAATPSGGARRTRSKRGQGYTKMDRRCPAEQTACPNGGGAGWACVDLADELEHCGACGNDCTTVAHVGGVACVAGQCVVGSCQPGFEEVDGICV